MNFAKYRERAHEILRDFSSEGSSVELKGIDPFLSIIEEIRKEGAVFIFKIDGARTSNPYTFAINGGPLGVDAIRIDCRKIEDGLSYVVVEYAMAVWDVE